MKYKKIFCFLAVCALLLGACTGKKGTDDKIPTSKLHIHKIPSQGIRAPILWTFILKARPSHTDSQRMVADNRKPNSALYTDIRQRV